MLSSFPVKQYMHLTNHCDRTKGTSVHKVNQLGSLMVLLDLPRASYRSGPCLLTWTPTSTVLPATTFMASHHPFYDEHVSLRYSGSGFRFQVPRYSHSYLHDRYMVRHIDKSPHRYIITSIPIHNAHATNTGPHRNGVERRQTISSSTQQDIHHPTGQSHPPTQPSVLRSIASSHGLSFPHLAGFVSFCTNFFS